MLSEKIHATCISQCELYPTVKREWKEFDSLSLRTTPIYPYKADASIMQQVSDAKGYLGSRRVSSSKNRDMAPWWSQIASTKWFSIYWKAWNSHHLAHTTPQQLHKGINMYCGIGKCIYMCTYTKSKIYAYPTTKIIKVYAFSQLTYLKKDYNIRRVREA